MESASGTARGGGGGREDERRKMELLQSELDRMKLLPASSAYAAHRVRVVTKMVQLLSLAPDKRSNSEVNELETLFATLSF